MFSQWIFPHQMVVCEPRLAARKKLAPTVGHFGRSSPSRLRQFSWESMFCWRSIAAGSTNWMLGGGLLPEISTQYIHEKKSIFSFLAERILVSVADYYFLFFF